MNLEIILSVVVMIVTFILGLVAKKVTWISNNLIPLQNLIIDVIMALIYFFITKDISIAIVSAGIMTGGAYDLVKNLKELVEEKTSPEEVSG